MEEDVINKLKAIKVCGDKGELWNFEAGIILSLIERLQAKNKKPELPEQKCECCGKIFKPKRRGTKYCSKECAGKSYWAKLSDEEIKKKHRETFVRYREKHREQILEYQRKYREEKRKKKIQGV